MLLRCIALALAQTRPPSEVVVVDASPDWEESRRRVLSEYANGYPEIRWEYVQAPRASAAAQRCECVERSTSDILFLIDDDSLMYSDCAEKVLRVYEADIHRGIAAVAIALSAEAPDDPIPSGESVATLSSQSSEQAPDMAGRKNPEPPIAPIRWVRSVLSADDLFVPYDEEFPSHPLPPEVAEFELWNRKLMSGMVMTVPRDLALAEPFEAVLERGSQGEDSDMSYRLSRHGKLVTAADARLFHVGAPAGRPPSMIATALGALNPMVLHVLHSTDIERSRKRSRSLLWRRLLINFLIDLREHSFSLPRTRGLIIALRMHTSIFDRNRDEVRAWYAQYQRDLFAQHGQPLA